MECQYRLCIYYADGFCTVDEVAINALAMCDACIVMDIPEDYLQKKRKEVLKRFAAEYTA